MPVEIAQILLAGKSAGSFHIFVADEFRRLNGEDEQSVRLGRERLDRTLDALAARLDVQHTRSYASELLGCESYRSVYSGLENAIATAGLEDALLSAVPMHCRGDRVARTYPLHELACVKHFCMQGYGLKLGPPSERKYDAVMQQLGFPIEFAYLAEAFAVGTKEAVPVVHYVPHAPRGQRIYLEDDARRVREKLLQANPQALHALTNLALAAAEARGSTVELPGKEKGKRLAVADLIFRHIVQEAAL